MTGDPERVSGELGSGHPENISGDRGRGVSGDPGRPRTDPPSSTPHRTPGRDWRTMTRHDFHPDAPAATLFALEPGQMTADDGHGTGDLLELLG